MPYIDLPQAIPGIRSLLTAFPETGEPLSAFTQQLLRGKSSLTAAERELIAACVSEANECTFCTLSHTAVAEQLFPETDSHLVHKVVFEKETSGLSEKMAALIDLALAVQKGGSSVTPTHIGKARAAGADDKAIHDTVLIAAAFCMFNRYVDGLATRTPEEESVYTEIGKNLASNGYNPANR